MKTSYLLSLILLGAAPFFFFGGPAYHSPQSYKAAWDLGHILFFSIATILLSRFLESRKPDLSAISTLVALFLSVLLLGVGVEVLQMLTSGRQPDPLDVARNQLGCLVGFGLVAWKSNVKWLKPFKYVVIVCLVGASYPFIRSVVDEQIARKQFPVLASFETPFERLRWKAPKQLKVQSKIVSKGKHAMQVKLTTAKYSGTSLFYFPGNWSGYNVLNFSVYKQDNKPLVLHCRIHDQLHKKNGNAFNDRFYQKFTVQQGWNTFQVQLSAVEQAPVSRMMDMHHIESFGLFVIEQPGPRTIYLDNIYLSK